MKVIKNRAFRIFLYILGLVSALSLILSGLATGIRLGEFSYINDFSKPYEENSDIVERMRSEVYNLQYKAKTEKELSEFDLSEKEIEIANYNDIIKSLRRSDGKPVESETTKGTVGELFADKSGLNEIIGVVTDAYYFTDFYSLGTIPISEDYDEDGVPGYIKLSWSDYKSLVKDVCEEFDYNKEYEDNTLDGLMEGDYYAYINNKLYIYSPSNSLISYDNYGSLDTGWLENNDYIYVGLTYEMEDIFSGIGEDREDAFKKAILSNYLYRDDKELIYSTFDEKERTTLRAAASYMETFTFGASSAYSLDGKNISRLWNYTGELYGNFQNINSGEYITEYSEFVDTLMASSDIFIGYDKESGMFSQWYRDREGAAVGYKYLSENDIRELISVSDESFAVGIDFNSDYSYYGIDKLEYEYCGYISHPMAIMVVSLIIFLLAVILLVIGEPAKIYGFDKPPIILHIVIYGILILCSSAMFYLFSKSIEAERLIDGTDKSLAISLLMMLVFLYASTATLVMTIVRRVKCHKFVDSLVSVRLFRWIRKLFRNLFDGVRGNVKLLVFLFIYILVNAIVLMALGVYCSAEAVVISVIIIIIDIIAALIMIKYMSEINTLIDTGKRIEAGDLGVKVDTERLHFNAREMGECLNDLGTGLEKAVETSTRDERMKAELITNVSHDIKTPLTSIINYVDLLKRENIENEKAQEYIEVLAQKSDRLKQLILDLIEASKTSTGNIEMEYTRMNFIELINQCMGEFEEKLSEAKLEVIKSFDTDVAIINADGRRVYRIIDNLLNNVCKYAQPGTRVFVDINCYLNDDAQGADVSAGRSSDVVRGQVVFSMKNVSREMLNISPEELTERFVRGDKSRYTEGSGLGLSIAKNLTELQGGKFYINIDGDLFKVDIILPLY